MACPTRYTPLGSRKSLAPKQELFGHLSHSVLTSTAQLRAASSFGWAQYKLSNRTSEASAYRTVSSGAKQIDGHTFRHDVRSLRCSNSSATMTRDCDICHDHLLPNHEMKGLINRWRNRNSTMSRLRQSHQGNQRHRDCAGKRGGDWR